MPDPVDSAAVADDLERTLPAPTKPGWFRRVTTAGLKGAVGNPAYAFLVAMLLVRFANGRPGPVVSIALAVVLVFLLVTSVSALLQPGIRWLGWRMRAGPLVVNLATAKAKSAGKLPDAVQQSLWFLVWAAILYMAFFGQQSPALAIVGACALGAVVLLIGFLPALVRIQVREHGWLTGQAFVSWDSIASFQWSPAEAKTASGEEMPLLRLELHDAGVPLEIALPAARKEEIEMILLMHGIQPTDAAAKSKQEQDLDQILVAYLLSIEGGGAADRAALIRQHPERAAALEALFQDRPFLERLAEPIQHPWSGPPAGDAGAAKTSAWLERLMPLMLILPLGFVFWQWPWFGWGFCEAVLVLLVVVMGGSVLLGQRRWARIWAKDPATNLQTNNGLPCAIFAVLAGLALATIKLVLDAFSAGLTFSILAGLLLVALVQTPIRWAWWKARAGERVLVLQASKNVNWFALLALALLPCFAYVIYASRDGAELLEKAGVITSYFLLFLYLWLAGVVRTQIREKGWLLFSPIRPLVSWERIQSAEWQSTMAATSKTEIWSTLQLRLKEGSSINCTVFPADKEQVQAVLEAHGITQSRAQTPMLQIDEVGSALAASEAFVVLQDHQGKRHFVRVERDFLANRNENAYLGVKVMGPVPGAPGQVTVELSHAADNGSKTFQVKLAQLERFAATS